MPPHPSYPHFMPNALSVTTLPIHPGLGQALCLQCFDAVGWAAGRASGLQKNWVVGCWRGYLSAARCPSCRPTNSAKALKAQAVKAHCTPLNTRKLYTIIAKWAHEHLCKTKKKQQLYKIQFIWKLNFTRQCNKRTGIVLFETPAMKITEQLEGWLWHLYHARQPTMLPLLLSISVFTF